MKKETRQFVIYSRKSKFTGKGESIENQIELCRQYIAVHFSQEEADAGCSSETMPQSRPWYMRMRASLVARWSGRSSKE